MHRLADIIGPAPSERSMEDFLAHLAIERNRVSREITAMKEKLSLAKRRPKRGKKATLAKQALSLLAERGLDLDDLEKILGGKNSSEKKKPMPAKTFEVWSEGYEATGESSGAQFHGEFAGETFRDAVEAFSYTLSESSRATVDLDKLTFWGCRFFDNEADARIAFG